MLKKNLCIGTYRIHNELFPILSEAWKRDFIYVDTAPNYRTGLAHEELKRCLDQAFQEKIISSPKEIKISTKFGYVPLHAKDFLYENKFIDDSEYNLNHSLSPQYVRYQIEQNIETLNASTLETFFIHNPEVQLVIYEKPEVLQRVRKCFEQLEYYVEEGRIEGYGIATWSSFEKEGAYTPFQLQDFIKLAEAIAGKGHHFKIVQFPLNFVHFQPLIQDEHQEGPLWEAQQFGIKVHVSSPLYGGRILKNKTDERLLNLLPGSTLAQKALVFAFSHPWIERILTSPSNQEQLDDTLSVTKLKRLNKGTFNEVLQILTSEKLSHTSIR